MLRWARGAERLPQDRAAFRSSIQMLYSRDAQALSRLLHETRSGVEVQSERTPGRYLPPGTADFDSAAGAHYVKTAQHSKLA